MRLSTALEVGGFGFLCFAAFQWCQIAGLCAVGVSLLLVGYAADDDQAIKEVYNHPLKYGFYLRERDFYPQIACTSVVIDSSIRNLPSFAKHLSINYRILRELNPWIRNYSLPNKTRKSYTFLVPKEGALNSDILMKKVPIRETFFHDTLKINEVH